MCIRDSVVGAALVVIGDDRDVGVRAADAGGDVGQVQFPAETVEPQLVGEAVYAVDDQIGPCLLYTSRCV